MKIGLKRIEKHELVLNKLATEGLGEIDGTKIIGVQDPKLRSGILSFRLDGIHPHDVCMIVDAEGVMVRSGSHCVHSWFNSRGIQGSVRASFYLYNTRDEVEKFLEVLKDVRKSM